MDYHLPHIYAGVDRGYIGITQLPERRTQFYSIEDLQRAQQFMLDAGQRGQIYHSWGVFSDMPSNGRGAAKDVIALPGLNLDWDIQSSDTGVHAKNDELPHSLDDILQVLEDAGIPQPTATVSSGNGYYGRYHFRSPYLFDTDDAREAARALAAGFHHLIGSAFRRAGWHMDNVSDLARITRAPGTLNHKTSPPKPVQLVSFDAQRLYDVEELRATVQPRAVRKTYSKPTATNEAVAEGEAEVSTKPRLEPIEAGCGWVRQVIANFSHLSEPDWFGFASLADELENGERIFHELSAQDSRYDEHETQSKLGRSPGPRTCENIHRDLGFDGCLACPFFGGDALRSPIQLGRVTTLQAKLMSSWAYNLETRQYIELTTGHAIDDRAFSDKFRAFTGKVTPHQLMNMSRFTRKVDQVDYLPGTLAKIVETGPRTLYNAWVGSQVKPLAGDYSVIDDHFRYVIPDDTERKHFLDVLAHALQAPSEKVRHVLTISGRQGTGKSFLGKLIAIIFGAHNVFTAESKDIVSRWTASMGNRQVLLIEEFGLMGKLEAYETLKRWVTDETVTVDEKFVPTHSARTPRLILALTNHVDPISISDDDRRFWLTVSPATPRPPAYYQKLFDQGLAQAPAFLHSLLERQIDRTIASAKPPMTSAKELLLLASRPAVEKELQGMLEENSPPFNRELVTRDEVHAAVRGKVSFKANVSAIAVGDAMGRLGFQSIGQKRVTGMGRPRLWAWKNVPKWLAATAEEIETEMMKTRFS